jgi:hypothetical protein
MGKNFVKESLCSSCVGRLPEDEEETNHYPSIKNVLCNGKQDHVLE